MNLRGLGLHGTVGIVGVILAGAVELRAEIIQTNYGTGDKSLPGPPVATDDLLQTALVSATRTGGPGEDDLYFYRENDGYPVDLARLSDGLFGPEGTVSGATVMPNQTTLTFTLDTTVSPEGYLITAIRTYAGWDSGRDGQAYTVEYSTVSAPDSFVHLATVTRFDNTSFPLTRISYQYDPMGGGFTEVEIPDEGYSHTAVELTGSDGFLATEVAAVRFIFNGVENGGTAYREFDLIGVPLAQIPEPAASAGLVAAAALAVVMGGRRRWRR